MSNLTRDRIVAAAADIVEEAGPDALTMRAVAQRLGAGTMSLYRHVGGREELLDLALSTMTGEVPPVALTGDWRADLSTIARDLRAGLVRRPGLTALLAARAERPGADLPALDRTLGALREAGFGRRGAVMAARALGSYVAGTALQEAGVATGGSTMHGDAGTAGTPGIGAVPGDQFPNIGWVGAKLEAPSPDERFEFGLACLLDGFAAYLARRAK